ncbi:MAG: SPOR domain-containing protein [Armatimonadetes bacterium]|nr:SPOR domain-containing protein [Armatimonadota bacterium]
MAKRRPAAGIGAADGRRHSGGVRTTLTLAMLGIGSALIGAFVIGPRLTGFLEKDIQASSRKTARSTKRAPQVSRDVDIRPVERRGTDKAVPDGRRGGGTPTRERLRAAHERPEGSAALKPSGTPAMERPPTVDPRRAVRATPPVGSPSSAANAPASPEGKSPGAAGSTPATNGKLYRVRVGPFGTREDAELVRDRLVEAGIETVPVVVTGGPGYSVQVGAYREEKNAISMADRVRASQHISGLAPKVVETENETPTRERSRGPDRR